MSIISFYPFSEKTKIFTPLPKPASKNIPEWYRRQPTSMDEHDKHLAMGFFPSTIKKCMPIFDIITAGYILGLPCDVYIDASDPEKLVYSVPAAMKPFQNDMFATHSIDQYRDYPIDKNRHHKDIIRICPFYAVGTEKGYSTMLIQPMHGDPTPLQAFSAIVDTDGFITDGHFSFLVEKGFKGVIKQGTPILQAIPFKRESFESKIVEQSSSEDILQRQRLKARSSFVNAYKNLFRSKKEYK
jgi:hypothetical protein